MLFLWVFVSVYVRPYVKVDISFENRPDLVTDGQIIRSHRILCQVPMFMHVIPSMPAIATPPSEHPRTLNTNMEPWNIRMANYH